MKAKTFKRVAAAVIAAVLVAAWCARVYTFNRDSDKVIIKVYNTGDTVPIGKNFCQTANEENEGYEFVVKGGKVTTTAQLLSDNGKGEHYLKELNPKNWEPKYVYVLEVLIRNNGNTKQIGVPFIGIPIVTDNLQIQVHEELFYVMYPKLDGAMGLAVRPDTEVTMYIPYASPEIDEYCDADFFTEEDLYFVISWYPEEIKIRVDTQV